MRILKQVGRLALVATLAASTLLVEEAKAASYLDVSTKHWAHSNIQQASEQGLMQGYPNGTFNPEGKVTRAEFLTVLTRTVDSTERIKEPFSDVSDKYWGKDAIEKAIALGFINPSDYGTKFNPDKALTREEIAEWLTNGLQHQHEAYKAIEQTIEASPQTLLPVTEFYRGGIKKSLYGDVGIMIGTGLMIGDQNGAFNPTKKTTRAEMATMILRYQEAAKKQASDFNAMNEIVEMSETGANVETATGFKYVRGSFKDVIGKKVEWSNGIGTGTVERMVMIDAKNMKDAHARSVYAKMFVLEERDIFAKNNAMTIFIENSFHLKKSNTNVLAYGQGTTSGLFSQSGTNLNAAKKYGYRTLDVYNFEGSFKLNDTVRLWVESVKYFEKNELAIMGLGNSDSFSIKSN